MQRKKYEIEILRLKIVLQDLFDAKEQHQIGSSELSSVLKEFRQRVKEDSIQKFDSVFFGIDNSRDTVETTPSSDTDIIVSEKTDFAKTKKKKSNSQNPAWVKKIYKNIVQRTHPDRFIDFPIEAIKNKFTKIYIDAVQAYEENDLGLLLLCAYEAEVKYDDIIEAKRYIQSSHQSAHEELISIHAYLGYQWYHLDDEKKLITLENYLRQSGFKFESKKAKDIIRKVSNRKPGTRPEKLIRVKIKKCD